MNKNVQTKSVVALLALIALCGVLLIGVLSNKTFSMKAEYKTAQIFIPEDGQLRPLPCAQDGTRMVLNQDTVIFKTATGEVGFKPIEFKNNNMEIKCRRTDGQEIMLYRSIPPKELEMDSDEVMFIVQPEMSVILTKENECRVQR